MASWDDPLGVLVGSRSSVPRHFHHHLIPGPHSAARPGTTGAANHAHLLLALRRHDGLHSRHYHRIPSADDRLVRVEGPLHQRLQHPLELVGLYWHFVVSCWISSSLAVSDRHRLLNHVQPHRSRSRSTSRSFYPSSPNPPSRSRRDPTTRFSTPRRLTSVHEATLVSPPSCRAVLRGLTRLWVRRHRVVLAILFPSPGPTTSPALTLAQRPVDSLARHHRAPAPFVASLLRAPAPIGALTVCATSIRESGRRRLLTRWTRLFRCLQRRPRISPLVREVMRLSACTHLETGAATCRLALPGGPANANRSLQPKDATRR